MPHASTGGHKGKKEWPGLYMIFVNGMNYCGLATKHVHHDTMSVYDDSCRLLILVIRVISQLNQTNPSFIEIIKFDVQTRLLVLNIAKNST